MRSMVRARSRWLGLAVAAAVLIAAAPAAAEPDAVKEVRLHFDGSAEVDAAQNAGIDLEHGATRVPNGIEVDAVVTDEQLLEAIALGADVVEPGEEFRWSFRASSTAAAADPLLQPPAPTVRVVRADYFTTKGQGFLYVEARTTRDVGQSPAPITMRLESDTGPGTPFGSARNMTRFTDSGEYMFHRNLFKVTQRPNQIRVTGLSGTTVDGQTTGNVSDWLRDVTPLTANPNYQWNFVDDYKHPQQLYARFDEIAQQYPEIAEIVTLPNKTNGYQRKAQAIIGTTTGTAAQAAVVVSSAAWGMRAATGSRSRRSTVRGPTCRWRSRSTAARCASCWRRARPGPWPAPLPRWRRRSRRARRA